jgi:hypothetical protein
VTVELKEAKAADAHEAEKVRGEAVLKKGLSNSVGAQEGVDAEHR